MMREVTLEKSAMLELWKRARGFEPLRADCAVTRTDGPDLDALLEMEMRAWYIRQLLTAPIEELPLSDIAPVLTLTTLREGVVTAPLPEGCVRVARVMMDGWERSALIAESANHPLAMEQTNRFARAWRCRPVAIVEDGWITLHGVVSHPPRGLSVSAVMLPAPELPYVLTEAMIGRLSTITQTECYGLS